MEAPRKGGAPFVRPSDVPMANKQNMDAEEVNTSEPPQIEENIPSDDEICRVCLLGNDEMRELFAEEEIPSLSVKAMSFTSVKMLPGDGLPTQVCTSCAEKLESAYEFKLQVEQADGILRERYVSITIKEELFFNEVEVHLEGNPDDENECAEHEIDMDAEDYPVETLDEEIEDSKPTLLKDHLALLQVEKLAEQEQGGTHEEDIEQSYEVLDDPEQVIEPSDNPEQTDVQSDNGIILSEKHGYMVQQESCFFDERSIAGLEEENSGKLQENERTGNKCVGEEKVTQAEHQEKPVKKEIFSDVETSPNETRRSKRKIKIAQKMPIVDHDSDEENYFENLNLSSRLKQTQSDRKEKIFFMCYLCDKQFLSKDVLKEHMHSHEEVRKAISLKKSPEKPVKIVTPVKSSPSGKQPNKCPYCGKEYLYVISYNKHLKQHESEKDTKQEPMPLEVSFHEDDNTLDFDNYNSYDSDPDYEDENDSLTCEKCAEKFHTSKALQKHMIKHELLKCSVCNEEFEGLEKLKSHQSKHVAEGVLTEDDLKEDIKNITKIREADPTDENTSNRRKTRQSSVKALKCPKCPMAYSHKKSLSRHLETHKGTKYGCKICGQQFTRKDHLRRHMEQHGRVKSFKCTQCNKTFGNELTLRNHLVATNHKTIIRGEEYDPNKRIKRVAAKAAQKIIDKIKVEDGLEEDDCSEASDVEPPLKKLTEKKQYECATCSRKCASKQSLTKHMEQHIKEEKADKRKITLGSDDDSDFDGGLDWPMDTHECPTCKKKYSTKKSLMRHQLLHEEPNFECDICNVKFYRKDKLKAHYDKCSEKNPDQVRKCNICGDSFENNEILKEHRAKHVTEGILTEEDLRDTEPQPEDRKPGDKVTRKRRTDIVGLECTECNKRYTSRKGLLRHIQVHEGKKYLCDICPKKFYRREHLKIHVAKHNMIKPYKCDRCTKRFSKEEQLVNHLSKHDRTFKKNKETDSAKRFLCEICSKSFTQSTTLIAHLRAHNGIKPYVCEVCSRPFTTNAYLKMHMRTHTQERPYICQYCSRAFARADTLANHLTSHTGEAKYHCKYCPKNFRRLKSLKEHVFIHTGQRPYACPTCDRRFNNNGSRYAHSKRCKQNLQQNSTRGQNSVSQAHRVQTVGQLQTIKTQNVKTITITRQSDSVTAQQVMQHQEILMPLILPLTVTLADVGEEVILPEGTKIFTTS